MKDKVQLEAFYPHPPERVWQALTDAKALSHWLMPTDFRPILGFRFRFDGPEKAVEGKVTDVEAARLLAYTWRDEDEGQASLVIWRLEPKDGGTQLRLEHVALEEPEVTCLQPVEAYFNWLYALRHSLPGMLILLSRLGRMPRAPIVYVDEEPVKKEAVKR
jgi:uncharacterized protein YndB with AHSA1/START domain